AADHHARQRHLRQPQRAPRRGVGVRPVPPRPGRHQLRHPGARRRHRQRYADRIVDAEGMPLHAAAGAASAARMEVLMKRFTTPGAWILLAAASGLAGCAVDQAPPSHGECTMNAAVTCDTILAGNPDAGVSSGLVGYSCTGVARPDENGRYLAGI